MTRRGLILFASLGIAWGIPYLFIKVAVTELEPAMLVLARAGLAAILLLPLALARKEVVPVLRRWKPMLAYTIVEIILPWYFLSSAEQKISSSTAGLLIAAVPLAGVAVARVLGKPERMSAWNWAGIVVGMLGVGALVGFDVGGSDLIAVAEVAIVVVGYALGSGDPRPLAVGCARRRHHRGLAGRHRHRLRAVRAAHRCAADAVAVVAGDRVDHRARRRLQRARLHPRWWRCVAEIGPVKSTAITYVNPAVAILAGVLILGERVTIWTIIGFALVLAGSYLVTRKRQEPLAADRWPGGGGGGRRAAAEEWSLGESNP